MTAPPLQPGALVDAGRRHLGVVLYPWSRCVTCDTLYPHLRPFEGPSCNGHRIGRCPYCAPEEDPSGRIRGLGLGRPPT